MVCSMTGFGRGSIEQDGLSFIVEMKSVNHRYLDINIKMPRSLLSLEDRVRKCIQNELSRGKIDVFITQNKLETQNEVASYNEKLAQSYVNSLYELRDKFNLKDDISVSLISRLPDVIVLSQQEAELEKVWQILMLPLNEALKNISSMRKTEGLKLKEDMLSRSNFLKSMILEIETKASTVPQKYKEKLNLRLKVLLESIPVDENRIAEEVAIYADKASIDEEIVRFKSHISQLEKALNLNEPVGRKLDFIVQEMNREINTIASKADDLDIVNITLNMKNEVEKIREQVQNIE